MLTHKSVTIAEVEDIIIKRYIIQYCAIAKVSRDKVWKQGEKVYL